MSYSKQELVEALIEFDKKNDRYPTRQDFKAKRITPSKNTFYRIFGNMENAIKQARLYEKGDLVLEEDRKIRPTKAISTKSGFQCSFCGSYTNNAEEYYSSLTTIIINRFVDLLNSHNGKTYFDGVLDCIFKVFGTRNSKIRNALRAAGYLEKFEHRYDHNHQNEDIN